MVLNAVLKGYEMKEYQEICRAFPAVCLRAYLKAELLFRDADKQCLYNHVIATAALAYESTNSSMGGAMSCAVRRQLNKSK